MKRILITTAIAIVCIFGLYTYLTWNSNGNPRFMHHRYNKVVTAPLAKIGFADAQYKMGLFWFYGTGESEPTKEEISNALYWWEKASAKGNEKASEELAKAKELLSWALVHKFDHVTENDIVMQITYAEMNGEDCSGAYKDADSFLVIYTRNNKPHFANVWPPIDTQTYGEITPLAGEEESHDGEIISIFSWDYQNTQNDQRGSTVVVAKFKDDAFDIRLTTESDKQFIFKGYIK